jgi:hypothetical protein
MADDAPGTEADPRFPSGKWAGFFTYHGKHEKNQMELLLTFGGGTMTGEGRDPVGEFTISGKYHTDDGACNFTKQYPRKHSVSYSGFNEGKGIWGTWEIRGSAKGGFHIWPEAMGDPSLDALTAEVDVPAPPPYEDPVTEDEKELVPAAA